MKYLFRQTGTPYVEDFSGQARELCTVCEPGANRNEPQSLCLLHRTQLRQAERHDDDAGNAAWDGRRGRA